MGLFGIVAFGVFLLPLCLAVPLETAHRRNPRQGPSKVRLRSNEDLYFEFKENQQMEFSCYPVDGRAAKLEMLIGNETVASTTTAKVVNFTMTAKWNDDGRNVECRAYGDADKGDYVKWSRSINVVYSPRAVDDYIENDFYLVEASDIIESSTLKVKIRSSPFPKSLRWFINGTEADWEIYTPTDIDSSATFITGYVVTGLAIKGVTVEELMRNNFTLEATNEEGSGVVKIKIKFKDSVDANDSDGTLLKILLVVVLIAAVVIGLAVFYYIKLEMKNSVLLNSTQIGSDGSFQNGFFHNNSLQRHFDVPDFFVDQRIFNQNGKSYDSAQKFAEAIGIKEGRINHMIIASAGMGKTMALVEIGKKLGELRKDYFVVHINVRSLFHQQNGPITLDSMVEFIKCEYLLSEKPKEISLLKNRLKDKKLLLLIDEINSPGVEEQRLDDLFQSLKGLQLIAAARTPFHEKYAQKLSIVADNIFQLGEISEKNYKMFLSQYLENISTNPSDLAEIIVSKLNEKRDLLKGEPIKLILAVQSFSSGDINQEFWKHEDFHKMFFDTILMNNVCSIFDSSSKRRKGIVKAKSILYQMAMASYCKRPLSFELSEDDKKLIESLVVFAESGPVFAHIVIAEYILADAICKWKFTNDNDDLDFPHESLHAIFVESQFHSVRSHTEKIISHSYQVCVINTQKVILDNGSALAALLREKLFLVPQMIFGIHFLNQKQSLDGKEQYPVHWTIDQLENNLNKSADFSKAIELFEFLISKGADLSVKDEKGTTPLTRLILMKNHSFDKYFCTQVLNNELLVAVKNGLAVEVVQSLIQFGADAETKDADEKNCLHIAAECGHVVLTQYFSDILATKSVDSSFSTPILLAAKAGKVQSLEILLESKQGHNVRLKDRGGNTCFHFAAQNGHINVVEKLVNAQCLRDDLCKLINEENSSKKSPLLLAIENNHQEIVTLLLENKAVLSDVHKKAGRSIGNEMVQLLRPYYLT